MKIEIRILTQLKQYLPNPNMAGDTLSMDMDDGVVIRDVMNALGIPLDMPKIIMLNDKQGRLEDELRESDRITVFPPLGGG